MHIRAIAISGLLAANPLIVAAGEVRSINAGSEVATGSLALAGAAIATRPNERQCPNPGRMDRLCNYIFTKSLDTDPVSDYKYGYQRVVYEASCVDVVNDSDEAIAEKVRAMWAIHGEGLRCGPMGGPPTGSPLRYAIHTIFHDFVSDALSTWKLDLNGLENGQTMLDFLDERISRASGDHKVTLEGYRRSFVRMGAKKADEL